MKVPPKRKGNTPATLHSFLLPGALNESPSEKEGKWVPFLWWFCGSTPSMKVPPKRKGNWAFSIGCGAQFAATLNESPSEKEGKSNLDEWPTHPITPPQ